MNLCEKPCYIDFNFSSKSYNNSWEQVHQRMLQR